jgi:hypothetical protein
MSSDQSYRAGSVSQGTQGTTHPQSGTRSSGTFDDVRERAGEAVSKFAEIAQQAGEQAKEAASSLAAEANQHAKGLLNQQIATGADLVNQIAGAARQAAWSLQPNAPQLANLVRGAADRAESLSRDLRGQSVDDLIRTASNFTRRQPALVFGLASVAGFLAFRVLKASPPDASDSPFQAQQNQFGHRAGEFHGV